MFHDLSARSKPKSQTERQRRIYTFLASHQIGVLSTVTPNSDPHGVVVYYALGEDFNVWLLTKRGTHKYDNLIRNNHAMLTVFDGDSQTTVQILGTATEHAEDAAINQVANHIFKRLMQGATGQLPPIIKLQAGAFTTFVIKPASIRMAMYARPDPGDYDQLFETIETFDLEEP